MLYHLEMGEVIQFPGNGEKNNNQDSILNLAKFTMLLETLTSLFTNNPGLKKNLTSRVEYLEDTTDKELVSIFNRSTESDWVQRPAYYAAIAERLKEMVTGNDPEQE